MSFKKILGLTVFILAICFSGLAGQALADTELKTSKVVEGHVAFIDLDMMILPGTQDFLESTLKESAASGAKILVVRLNTPGGLLTSAQEMIRAMFKASIPVVVYVAPTGSTATSAGVFITLAAHLAVMAPGTSIGAAHPVMGDGKDIEGDMRTKAENMTIAMVKSISDERGRNLDWAEKAVKESDSITEKEAVKKGVIDYIASDLDDLLKKAKGRKVKIGDKEVALGDYSSLPRKTYEMSYQQKTLNFLANPNVAALLWLAATTGLSIELYNPGAILPGVVGVICLILALLVSQVIPISQAGLLLLVVGAALIGAEFFVPSGILGVGGAIAIVLGAMYLIDVGEAPGMHVDMMYVVPIAIGCALLMLLVAGIAIRVMRRAAKTGKEGLIGMQATAIDDFLGEGKVMLNGEVWRASSGTASIAKGDKLEVVSAGPGLVVEVKKLIK